MRYEITNCKRNRMVLSNLDYWKITVRSDAGETYVFNCTPGADYNHHPQQIIRALKKDLSDRIEEKLHSPEDLILGQVVTVDV